MPPVAELGRQKSEFGLLRQARSAPFAADDFPFGVALAA
jgi:hypothetical protein